MPFPIAEQTCSIFSLMFYFHLDPIIFLGYRVPHLKSDQLPPSPDSDYVKNLLSKHFPVCDATLIIRIQTVADDGVPEYRFI